MKKIKFNYRPLPPQVNLLTSEIDGLGLHASTDIPAGCEIGRTHTMSFENEWIRTPLGGFINHSDQPNCFNNLRHCHITLTTIKPISEGEELTVYYRLDQ